MTKQKSNKQIENLNDTANQCDLTDTTLNTRVHFSQVYVKHSLTNLIPRTGFNKFWKAEIIQSIFSDQNGMKLEIVTEEKLRNSQTCGN